MTKPNEQPKSDNAVQDELEPRELSQDELETVSGGGWFKKLKHMFKKTEHTVEHVASKVEHNYERSGSDIKDILK